MLAPVEYLILIILIENVFNNLIKLYIKCIIRLFNMQFYRQWENYFGIRSQYLFLWTCILGDE